MDGAASEQSIAAHDTEAAAAAGASLTGMEGDYGVQVTKDKELHAKSGC